MDFSKFFTVSKPRKVVMIGDFNNDDLDDELSLFVANKLVKSGQIELLGVIANTNPAIKRARLAKGILDLVGLVNVPVGVGGEVFEKSGSFFDEELLFCKFGNLEEGQKLLAEIFRNAFDGEITLVLQSAMTDAMEFLAKNEELFARKIFEVVIMGGVEIENGKPKLNQSGFMTPNMAMNNFFDMSAAKWLYSRLQALNIPMVISTREVAISSQISSLVFEEMTPDLRESLRARYNLVVQRLWQKCCQPENSAMREKFPADRNREWFVRVFCGGVDPLILATEDVLPFVTNKRLNPYDPINLVLAVPELRKAFAKPFEVKVGKTKHQVIGLTSEDNGLKDEAVLAKFVEWLLVG